MAQFLYNGTWTPLEEEGRPPLVLVLRCGNTAHFEHGGISQFDLLKAAGFRTWCPSPPADEEQLYNAEPPAEYEAGDGGYNLASYIDKFVGPKILSDPDFRPQLVYCASKGGYHSIHHLWRRYWRGPTIVQNAGAAREPDVPLNMPLCVTSCTGDMKDDKGQPLSPQDAEQLLSRPFTGGYLWYHSAQDGHGQKSVVALIVTLARLTLRGLKLADGWPAELAACCPPQATFRFKGADGAVIETTTEALREAQAAAQAAESRRMTAEETAAMEELVKWAGSCAQSSAAMASLGALDAADGLGSQAALRRALQDSLSLPGKPEGSLYVALALVGELTRGLAAAEQSARWLELVRRFATGSKEPLSSAQPVPAVSKGEKGKGQSKKGEKGGGKGDDPGEDATGKGGRQSTKGEKGGGKEGQSPSSPMSKAEAKPRLTYREKEEAKAKKEFEEQNAQRTQEFKASLQTSKPCSLEKVPWSTAQVTLHLAGGHGNLTDGGVTAMQLGGGEVIMLRMQDLTTELVALSVANCLDVRVAQHRLVHPSDPEWEAIRDAEVRATPGLPSSEDLFKQTVKSMGLEGEEAEAKLEEMLRAAKSTRCVLEFVPGPSLDVAAGLLASPSTELLRALGKLCALDLLLNNWDRVPLTLWDNELGNLSNVVVVEEGRGAVGIDQQVNVITDEAGLEEYLSRVRHLATRVVRRDYAHTSLQACLAKTRAALNTVIGKDWPDSCIVTIFEGMQEGLVKAAGAVESGVLNVALAAAAEAGSHICEIAGRVQQPPKYYTDFVQAVAAEVEAVVKQETAAGYAS